ncbi:MAG: transposase, partial [Candidatus Marinimicrobia bacterium]|nr:transposase [Candidatus Neomarinimicrobiota bacterium]
NDKWKWIFKQYNHIRMDKYVIIPDHFHAIIRILPDSQGNVWAGPVPPAHLDKRKRYSLSKIIGAFKTKSSISIHKAGYINYKWKRSFHDRIIRDDELEIKRNYIRNNPINWHK